MTDEWGFRLVGAKADEPDREYVLTCPTAGYAMRRLGWWLRTRPDTHGTVVRRDGQHWVNVTVVDGDNIPSRTPVTPGAQRILDTIRVLTMLRGRTPTVREVSDRPDMPAYSTVRCHVVTLEQAGWVRRDGARHNTLVLLDSAA